LYVEAMVMALFWIGGGDKHKSNVSF
jgi:hypothetical protein